MSSSTLFRFMGRTALTVLLMASSTLSAQTLQKASARQVIFKAQKYLPGIENIQLNPTSQRPVLLQGTLARDLDLGNADAVRSFLRNTGPVFGLQSADHDFTPVRYRKDDLGMVHTRVQHYYKGVKVFGSEIILHADARGVVKLMNGQLVDDIDVDVTPRITADQAFEIAKKHVGARTFRWQDPVKEAILKQVYNDPSKTWKPTPELVIAPNKGRFLGSDFRLAYKLMLPTEEPVAGNWTYFIDAHTGEVINRWNSMHSVNAVGTGNSLYSGTVDINTNDTGTTFEMYDVTRNIKTYNANNSTILPGTLFTDADNVWDAAVQNAAVDHHWGAMQFYDYYKNVHGRNSIDGNGMQIVGSVHYSTNYNNASWDGSQARFGDGDGIDFDPLVTVDISAHEYTHGVTDFESNLVYQSEPGALNEALSDIFGTAVEFYAKPGTANWMVGEECYTPATPGDALRYMDNPNQGGDPDTYKGDFWASTANPNPFNDWGGVHTNSGVANHQFYLLTEGGSGTNDNGDSYSVTGIGITKAAKIWYRAQTTYLTTNSQYSDARNATVNAAIDLYGDGSQEHIQVQNAWHAVGVGAPGGGGGGGNTPPVPTITSPADGATFPSGSSINYAGDATDAEDGTVAAGGFVWIANGPGLPADYVFASGVKSGTVTPPQDGTYTITLEVTDSGGLKASTSVTITIGGTANQPPTAVAEATPTSGTAPLTVNFTGSNSSDPDGTIQSYSWDFGDGNSSTQADPTHTYSTAGTYTAVLTVTDDAGATGTDQVTITVSSGNTNTPPVATITSPNDGDSYPVGTTITFTGEGTDAEDGTLPAANFTWKYQFNGGAETVLLTGSKSGSGTLTYPGTYTLILEVQDSDGATGRDQITITATGGAVNAGISGEGATAPMVPGSVPQYYGTLSNYPNPFNPETTIAFTLERSQPITLAIYNVIGQRVRLLREGFTEKGRYTLRWDGRDDSGRALTSGIYYLRLAMGNTVVFHKIVMMK